MQPKEEEIEFDWVSLHRDMENFMPTETLTQKFVRKFKENPLVPIGALATFSALCYGLWCFKTGQRRMGQYMMRTRIAAQGFTVFAMLVGIGMSARKAAEADQTGEKPLEFDSDR